MNPGCALAHYSLSRGAPSATWVLLHEPVNEQMAEREGFEPPVPFSITSFQDWRLKPLGHLSIALRVSCILARRADRNGGWIHA